MGEDARRKRADLVDSEVGAEVDLGRLADFGHDLAVLVRQGDGRAGKQRLPELDGGRRHGRRGRDRLAGWLAADEERPAGDEGCEGREGGRGLLGGREADGRSWAGQLDSSSRGSTRPTERPCDDPIAADHDFIIGRAAA